MRTDQNWRRRVALPMALALSATACSTLLQPPPQPVQAPRLPAPPAELMEPPNSGSWSESVRQLYRKWQQLLTQGTPA